MVNIARGLVNSTGLDSSTDESSLPTPEGPASQITSNTEMPGAFGAALIESVKASEPASSPGVPEQLEPALTNELHRRLGFWFPAAKGPKR